MYVWGKLMEVICWTKEYVYELFWQILYQIVLCRAYTKLHSNEQRMGMPNFHTCTNIVCQ